MINDISAALGIWKLSDLP